MRRLLVKWLLRLTDIAPAPAPNEKTEAWLASAFSNEGFRTYITERERKMKNYLSTVGTEILSREKYLLGVGQLQELTNLVNYTKNAYEATMRRASKKLEKDQKAK